MRYGTRGGVSEIVSAKAMIIRIVVTAMVTWLEASGGSNQKTDHDTITINNNGKNTFHR